MTGTTTNRTATTRPRNQQDPSTWLEPDQPLIGADSRDWSWCYVWFEDVPDFPGYKAEWHGDIWSCRKPGFGVGQKGRWKRLKPRPNRDGYLRVTLYRERATKSYRLVHDVILAAFVGPCPPGMECLHGDGRRSNNRLANLRWGTKSENKADMRRHGTSPIGDRNPRAKLQWADISVVRRLRREGRTQQEVAAIFGVSKNTVSQIDLGRRWREAQ